MLPEQSKQTQLVARVARRLIGSNMDIPEVVNIKWSVRVIVSYYYFENLYNFFSFKWKDTDVKNGKLLL